MNVESIGSPALWGGFLAFVVAMLALDLGVFHREAHRVTVREAAGWSLAWVTLALAFAAALGAWFGHDRALEFTAGWLIEKALAVDNIFVFVVIFRAFGIPAIHQHRVLFWGVFGALLMRAAFIFAGGAFLAHFHWGIYLFGAILVATGLKLLFERESEMHPEDSAAVRLFKRLVPTSPELHGDRFFVERGGRRLATPLLLALVTVEVTDLVFAVDSIPAIFAVTSDPFIVFTSNIFAILGLRSLYFLLAGVIDRFAYLKVGLAGVLVFVGAKMVLADVVKLPIEASLGVIAAILAASVAASVLLAPGDREESSGAGPGGAPALPASAD
ncbi:MAG: TerC family protein [Alphaproteobacteria bacterium]